MLFVLVRKDILISPNDSTSLPSVVSNLLQDYEDVFSEGDTGWTTVDGHYRPIFTVNYRAKVEHLKE